MDIIHRRLFISGSQDPVLQMVGDDALDIMRGKVKDLRDLILIPDAGHFVQLEQADEFNYAVINFLKILNI